MVSENECSNMAPTPPSENNRNMSSGATNASTTMTGLTMLSNPILSCTSAENGMLAAQEQNTQPQPTYVGYSQVKEHFADDQLDETNLLELLDSKIDYFRNEGENRADEHVPEASTSRATFVKLQTDASELAAKPFSMPSTKEPFSSDDEFVDKPKTHEILGLGRGRDSSMCRSSPAEINTPTLKALLTTEGPGPAKRSKVSERQVKSSGSKGSGKKANVAGTPPKTGRSSVIFAAPIVISESDSESEFQIFSQAQDREVFKRLSKIKHKVNIKEKRNQIEKEYDEVRCNQKLEALVEQIRELDRKALRNANERRLAQEKVQRLKETERVLLENRDGLLQKRERLQQFIAEIEANLQEERLILNRLTKKLEWMRKF